MAFTERYVRDDAAGGGDGTTNTNSGANGAWTFAEMITAAPAAGIRVNVRSGTYSVGAYTLGAGTIAAPLVIRGFNSTIGDLDNQGRNADGTLNTTNFPTITITAAWTPGAFAFLQNLNITAALSGYIITGVNDGGGIISCKLTNTQNNTSAGCCSFDDFCRLINSDFEVSGDAHTEVVVIDASAQVLFCRFKSSNTNGSDSSAVVRARDGGFVGNLIWGNSFGTGLEITNDNNMTIINNTFYNCSTAITSPNIAQTRAMTIFNNSITNCATGINNLWSGTSVLSAIVANNRTRDVSTVLNGLESIQFGDVTTDTGGVETDYTDATNGNFRLISSAPGRGVGMTAYTDIGAYQRAEQGAGGAFTWSN